MKQAYYSKGNAGALPKISKFRKKIRRGRGLTLVYLLIRNVTVCFVKCHEIRTLKVMHDLQAT